MYFLRAGSGAPALVFVHGFACCVDDWKPQLEHFQKTHEVVACDLRGHGRTPGRPQECSIEHYGGDVAALVNNLELKRCVLVGHSMGCRVVLEAARATVEKLGYAAFAEMLFRQMFFTPSAQADAIVARALKSSAEFGPELWPRISRWDAGSMDAAFDAVLAPVLAIQSTTRNAQL